jgi:hypothetical protein
MFAITRQVRAIGAIDIAVLAVSKHTHDQALCRLNIATPHIVLANKTVPATAL